VTAVRLSDRQRFALLALYDLGTLVYGDKLAARMTELGRETSVAAAHQAANGLVNKGLSAKRYTKSTPIRYEITDTGRKLAVQVRSES
jgi:hypothetical protein